MPRVNVHQGHVPAAYQAGVGDDSFNGEEFGESLSMQITDEWETLNDETAEDYEDFRDIDLPSYDDDI